MCVKFSDLNKRQNPGAAILIGTRLSKALNVHWRQFNLGAACYLERFSQKTLDRQSIAK